MRLLIIFILFLTPIASKAQTTPEIEKAYYEVNVNGESAYYTDLECGSGPLTKTQFHQLEEIAMEKEGIFNLEYLNSGKTIRIAHLSYVETQALKQFGKMICDEMEIEERQPYSFQ